MSAQSKAKIISSANTNAYRRGGSGALPQVSDPADFPVPLQGEITVELSSGRVVTMVIAELEMLYEMGEIPNDLARIAARELVVPVSSNESEREKRFMERLRLVKWVAGRVLVEPKIEIDRLYRTELWEIYEMANSPARALENFRVQQARHVGAVSGLQDVGAEAEPTATGEAA